MLRPQKATCLQILRINSQNPSKNYKLTKKLVYLQFVTKLEHSFRFCGQKMDRKKNVYMAENRIQTL